MAKRVVAAFTYTSANGRVTGVNGNFSAFKFGDAILIASTVLNNGFFEIVGIDAANGAFLQLAPPPKDEGPILSEIRTA